MFINLVSATASVAIASSNFTQDRKNAGAGQTYSYSDIVFPKFMRLKTDRVKSK
jgi:hypothetical protein